MDVVKTVSRVVAALPPAPAARVLEALKGRWYEYPGKRYDFDSWSGIVRTLAERVARCPHETRRWRERFPRLLVASRVNRRDLPRYNRRRQALAWARRVPGRYRLVQDGFLALGYETLESVCEAQDGFSILRDPNRRDPARTRPTRPGTLDLSARARTHVRRRRLGPVRPCALGDALAHHRPCRRHCGPRG